MRNRNCILEADTVLLNGTIYTMVPDSPTCNGLAIKDGKVLYVGTSQGTYSYIGPKTQVKDLHGKMVLPAFSDSHMHPASNHLYTKMGVDLTKYNDFTKQPEEIIHTYIDAITSYCSQHPEKEIIYGYGWYIGIFSDLERLYGPTKERLDCLNIKKPIVLYSYDLHMIWLNSKALESFHIGKHTGFVDETVPCDMITKHNNRLWGTVKEDAFLFVPPPKFKDEDYIDSFLLFQEEMLALGITCISSIYADHIPGSIPYRIYKRLLLEGKLTLHIAYSEVIALHKDKGNPFLCLKRQMEHLIAIRHETDQESRFKVISGKLFIDGVVDTNTALLTSAYEKNTWLVRDYCGYNHWENHQEELLYVISELNRNGLQAHFHAIGDGAIAFILDSLDRLRVFTEENVVSTEDVADPTLDLNRLHAFLSTIGLHVAPVLGIGITLDDTLISMDQKIMEPLVDAKSTSPTRQLSPPPVQNVVTHMQLIRRRDIPRFKKHNLIASLQTFWHIKQPIFWEAMEYEKLGERAEYQYPLRSLCDHGILIAGASDYPITAPPDPIIGIQRGITRNYCDHQPGLSNIDDSSCLLNKNERLSLQDMLIIYTKNSAISNGFENTFGTIEVGKKANLIVLSHDLTNMDPLLLHHAKVLITLMEGDIIYQDTSLTLK